MWIERQTYAWAHTCTSHTHTHTPTQWGQEGDRRGKGDSSGIHSITVEFTITGHCPSIAGTI